MFKYYLKPIETALAANIFGFNISNLLNSDL